MRRERRAQRRREDTGNKNNMDDAKLYMESIGFKEVKRECNGPYTWEQCESGNSNFARPDAIGSARDGMDGGVGV